MTKSERKEQALARKVIEDAQEPAVIMERKMSRAISSAVNVSADTDVLSGLLDPIWMTVNPIMKEFAYE